MEKQISAPLIKFVYQNFCWFIAKPFIYMVAVLAENASLKEQLKPIATLTIQTVREVTVQAEQKSVLAKVAAGRCP